MFHFQWPKIWFHRCLFRRITSIPVAAFDYKTVSIDPPGRFTLTNWSFTTSTTLASLTKGSDLFRTNGLTLISFFGGNQLAIRWTQDWQWKMTNWSGGVLLVAVQIKFLIEAKTSDNICSHLSSLKPREWRIHKTPFQMTPLFLPHCPLPLGLYGVVRESAIPAWLQKASKSCDKNLLPLSEWMNAGVQQTEKTYFSPPIALPATIFFNGMANN